MMLKEQYVDKTRVAVFGKVSLRRALSEHPCPLRPRALSFTTTQPQLDLFQMSLVWCCESNDCVKSKRLDTE